MPMEHNTPLSYHFKHKHIWFDIAVLAALFVVSSYVPLLKIVPLVASLELFSFFSFHLLAKRSRFQLQGFFGGFISSTAVFLQVLNDPKFGSTGQRDLMLALLFALCAMLLECVLIIFFLAGQLAPIYYVPFLSQLAFFVAAILYLNRSNLPRFAEPLDSDDAVEVDITLLNDHPIIWKNVAKLSSLILLFVVGMHYIGTELGLSRSISTLVISLFEAHAILASVMTEWTLEAKQLDLMQLFFLILLGNTISKSYLAYRGPNLTEKVFFVGLIFTGFFLSLGLTLLWSLTLT